MQLNHTNINVLTKAYDYTLKLCSIHFKTNAKTYYKNILVVPNQYANFSPSQPSIYIIIHFTMSKCLLLKISFTFHHGQYCLGSSSHKRTWSFRSPTYNYLLAHILDIPSKHFHFHAFKIQHTITTYTFIIYHISMPWKS